jgi:hypothetical protein
MPNQNGGAGLYVQGLKPSDVALLQQVATEAANQAVTSTFTRMGLDPAEPLVSQAIFAKLREMAQDEELPADFDWTRRTRTRMEGMLGKALLTAVALAVVGAAHTAWAGVKALLAVASVLP